MPRASRPDASESASTHGPNAENQRGASSSSSSNRARGSRDATRGRKRKSTESDLSTKPKRGKKAKEEVPNQEERKPRLTTPDLEFDFDRSQLRDPRPTPGRVKRPRRDEYELPPGFKEQFYVPKPAVLKKGRLNAFDKEKSYREAGILDPSSIFHDLYVCDRKGRNGSPTYDSAGFQLDYDKVRDWMQPNYSRKGAINGMERSIKRQEREEREMYDIFFVDGKGPKTECTSVKEYVQDHVSKDLGIPWHQIGPQQLVEWEKKAFPMQNAEQWWREPNEEERRRMSKMQLGSSLRKDL